MNISSASTSDFLPPTQRFWLYFVFYVPSVPCSLFLLYEFISDRTLRRSINNHVIILLLFTVLFCQATMYPWMFYHYHHSDTWVRSYAFCAIWAFIDWSLYVLQLLLFAWASIERHILIFHDKWVSTKRRRFWVHYFPLMAIPAYWFVIYSYIYFYPSCPNNFDPTSMLCVAACLYDDAVVRGFETFLHNTLPNIVIIVFSLGLLVRVTWKKYRLHQAMQWRKSRKMTIQLMSISAMYLFVTAPWGLTNFLRLCGWWSTSVTDLDNYVFFISYYIVFLFPFVALTSLPNLQTRLKRMVPKLWVRRPIWPQPPLPERNAPNNQTLT